MAVLVADDPVLTEGRTRPLNLAEGGQQGAMMAPHQWVSNAGYVKQKVIAVLLSAPGGYQYLQNKAGWVANLKSLIETLPVGIDGLNSTVSWDFNEVTVGNAGEMFESVTKGNRERSVPSFRWPEKYGAAIQRFWTEHGRLLLEDPDLGVPGIVSEPLYINAGRPALLPDMRSFTVLFIEPDETMSRVTHAWLSTNMMPKSGGEVTGKREMNAANDQPEVSIDFTALTLRGRSVIEQAKTYLASLDIAGFRPTELKPFVTGASADVAASLVGFKDKVRSSIQNF